MSPARRIVVAALLSLAPAAAFAFEDAATGFAARPPKGFVVAPSHNRTLDVAVTIDPLSGFPPKAGSSASLCKAGFKAAASNAGLSQTQIDAGLASPQWRDLARATVGLIFEVTAIRKLRLRDVLGAEMEARPRFGPDHEDARAYLTIHETPKGRVTLVCVTTKAAWEKALPLFRAIRGGLIPPM